MTPETPTGSAAIAHSLSSNPELYTDAAAQFRMWNYLVLAIKNSESHESASWHRHNTPKPELSAAVLHLWTPREHGCSSFQLQFSFESLDCNIF